MALTHFALQDAEQGTLSGGDQVPAGSNWQGPFPSPGRQRQRPGDPAPAEGPPLARRKGPSGASKNGLGEAQGPQPRSRFTHPLFPFPGQARWWEGQGAGSPAGPVGSPARRLKACCRDARPPWGSIRAKTSLTEVTPRSFQCCITAFCCVVLRVTWD